MLVQDAIQGHDWSGTTNGTGVATFKGTERVTEIQAPFEPSLYAEKGYDVVHCGLVMELLHIASLSGGMVTHEAVQLGHADHYLGLVIHPQYRVFGHGNVRPKLTYFRCMTCAVMRQNRRMAQCFLFSISRGNGNFVLCFHSLG